MKTSLYESCLGRTASKEENKQKRYFTKGLIGSFFALTLALQPLHSAQAADGDGTAVVDPLAALAGATGADFEFIYTATSALGDGAVSLEIPAPWANPTPANTTVTVNNGLTGEVVENFNTGPLDAGWILQTTGIGTLANISRESSETSDIFEGNGSLEVNIPLIGVTDLIQLTPGSVTALHNGADDWTGKTAISFQIKKESLASLSLLNGFDFLVSSQANLAGATVVPLSSALNNLLNNDLVDLGLLDGGGWVQVVLPINVTNVGSYGFRFTGVVSINLLANIHIDHIMVGPSGPIFDGNTVTQPLIFLNQGGTVVFDYHDVNVPNEDGAYEFPISSQDNADGSLQGIDNSPVIQVIDPNGGGDNSDGGNADGGNANGGNANAGNGGEGDDDNTHQADIDEDGGDEYAVDTNEDGCYSDLFFDPNTTATASTVCFTIDGSDDSCGDFFIDTDQDGCQVCPEVFWNATDEYFTDIRETTLDVDGDGDVETVCAYDSDGDGDDDSFIIPGNGTVGGEGAGEKNPFDINGGGCSLNAVNAVPASFASLMLLCGVSWMGLRLRARRSK